MGSLGCFPGRLGVYICHIRSGWPRATASPLMDTLMEPGRSNHPAKLLQGAFHARHLLAGTILSFAILLLGCKPAPTKNTIIAKAESPDGKSSAVLVERYYQAARVSDVFFLVVIPVTHDVNEAKNARHIGDTSALVATRADKVRLRWQNDKHPSCDLRSMLPSSYRYHEETGSPGDHKNCLSGISRAYGVFIGWRWLPRSSMRR